MEIDQELERVANGYAAKGYEVMVRPGPSDLPPFARDFQIEIVGRRGGEGVLVAVKRNREDAAGDRSLPRYAELTAEQPAWRFDLVILEGEGPIGRQPPEARDLSPREIETALAEAGELVRGGYLRPAVISAWAALEAAMRMRLRAGGARTGWGSMPRVMLNELYSSGVLTARELREIERFSRWRNEIVHGFTSPTPDATSVQLLSDIARRLTEESQPLTKSA